jgi:hypothetical protein
MSTCPACGVAVVPGYVKCPKCGKALPQVARPGNKVPGGTSLEEPTSSRSLWLVLGGAAVLAIAVALVLSRANGGAKKATAGTQPAVATAPAPVTTQPTPVPQQDDSFTSTQPQVSADAQPAVNALDAELKKQRLWGTVSLVGTSQVDVRTAACEDPGMGPLVDGARAQLKAAGLTKLRCLTQSGAVVFERNL